MEPNILTNYLQEVFCSIEGTITGIIPNFGWYYLACKNCFKRMKTSETSENKRCPRCPSQPTKLTYAYMLTVKVKDSTGSATLVMFDRQAKSLIGVPVQHILDTYEASFLKSKFMHR